MVIETDELLSLTKDIAATAYLKLVELQSTDMGKVSYSKEVPREMKCFTDEIIEEVVKKIKKITQITKKEIIYE